MNTATRVPTHLIFHHRSSFTSLRSFTNSSRAYSTGWRLRSGLLSSVQSLCINVFTDLRHHTSLTNSVRWRTLRLVNDFVPPRLHHWLSAVLNCPSSVTGLFWSPLLVFGTVYLNTLPPHSLWLSYVKTHLFSVLYPILVCAVPMHWHSLLWTL